MKKAATFVAILYGLFLLAGCSSTPPAAPTTDTISFKIIAQGQHSGIGFEQFFEIRHPDDWQTLWQRHSTSEPLPLINFQETMLIAVFYGQKQTSGYAIQIKRIIETPQQLIAHVELQKPARHSQRNMMITQPFMIVSLPRSNKPVSFHFQQVDHAHTLR